MLKLGILGSTRGSNLLPLIELLQQRSVPAQVAVVLSDREQAGILDTARAHHWPAFWLSAQQMSREAYDAMVSARLKDYHCDLVLLLGYMRIVSAPFVQDWQHRLFNVHPSLLPAHAGKMDRAVHQSVLDAGERESGCTVHEVSEIVDAGPVLVQITCPVQANDDVDSLKARVQALEVQALAQAIQQFKLENRHAICTH